ncbi:NAD-dependent epimerase/dehydratase family protein [Sinorhizobium terangae]|uniref:NAD-dependent epimerase/dehydratase family protein n=1 Tax=Sinorhizobium terangae TaxID=110322 RepID=UPI0024B131FC|nr:NAD(P)-dependent oxidoreductase [Sinorhizobium terangae]WFU51024.1 NAD(P)-dependent oxidoreductase [Sinorhizobium terangae]
MQLVVTGATGFIASRLIGQALSKGYQVIALARDPDRVTWRKSSRLQIEKWSIGDPLPAVTQADAVFHLAAYIPADFSDPRQAARCFEVNTNGALRFAMDAASQGVKRFVFFGSGQVYTPASESASETSAAFPVHRASYYLASKLSAEICLLAFGTANTMPVTVLRLASVYGPGMHGSGMIPTFIRTLGSGRPVAIRDGGRYRVDLVYVDDVISLALAAVEKEQAGIFNAGSGQACRSLEAAEIIADALGADPDLVNVEGARSDETMMGFAALNVAKAVDQLGYIPRSFRQGIEAWKAETGFSDFQSASSQE